MPNIQGVHIQGISFNNDCKEIETTYHFIPGYFRLLIYGEVLSGYQPGQMVER
jgi:hypothetical protein